jgi:ribosomal protein S18 acetylase RimI-like enzyme
LDTHEVEQLAPGDLELVKPLLVDLQLQEQVHYRSHPQLSRAEVERSLPEISAEFQGENIILAVREAAGRVVGFCWLVLFDPGTGLEGEVAEVYVAESHRGRGVGDALLRRAVDLFRSRGVTLGYVWTRPENEAATRLYRSVGFQPTEQLILTWYPTS